MFKELSNTDENSSKSQHETLTPYKIGVILLIKEYCLISSKSINNYHPKNHLIKPKKQSKLFIFFQQ